MAPTAAVRRNRLIIVVPSSLLLRHERLDLIDRGRDLELEELTPQVGGCGSRIAADARRRFGACRADRELVGVNERLVLIEEHHLRRFGDCGVPARDDVLLFEIGGNLLTGLRVDVGDVVDASALCAPVGVDAFSRDSQLGLALAVIAHEKDVLEPGRRGALRGLSHDTEEDLRTG